MSFSHLEKIEILEGNDMFPCILPHEKLLLDKSENPKIGDVVLFVNRYGMRIPHRVIHIFGNYYFTRGDSCRYFNFPCHRKDILGVVLGKNKDIIKKPAMNIFLDIFLLYFLIYKSLFNIKKKKEFWSLCLVTKLFAPLDSIYYKSSYDNDYLNRIVYQVVENPKDPPAYYARKAYDNMLITDKKFLLYKDAKKIYTSPDDIKDMLAGSIKEINSNMASWTLKSVCEDSFNLGKLNLRHLLEIRKLLRYECLKDKKIRSRGTYEIIGVPLIALYLFNIKYNKGKDRNLADFVEKNYYKQIPLFKRYMEERDYTMPIDLVNLYDRYRIFGIFRFIKYRRPDFGERGLAFFDVFISPLSRLKYMLRILYMRRQFVPR